MTLHLTRRLVLPRATIASLVLLVAFTAAIAAPQQPSGLTATALSSSQVRLNWQDVPTEDGFIVQRASASSGPWSQVGTTLAGILTYTNSGLTGSTTYYYRVQAKDKQGALSPVSATASATTPAAPPAAPSGLTAAGSSSTQISLSWSDNATNETGYLIERAAASAGPWSQIATTASGASSYANSGLTTGTTYYYRVRATNSAGSSAYSNVASAATSSGVPPAPTLLTTLAQSSTQIFLQWTDNGDTETGFVIERAASGSGPWTQIGTSDVDVPFFTNTGLSGGTTYYYRVKAINGAGSSPYSNVASGTTPAGAPVAPTNLTGTAASSSQVNLTWTDNATNESGYKVERWTGSAWLLLATLGANSSSYANTGLTASTQYLYHVTAYNTAGYATSANASVTTLGSGPASPTALTATPLSWSQIRLNWTDNASNETGFKVDRAPAAAGPWVQVGTATTPTYTDTTLASQTTYYFRVRAYNGSGDSGYTSTVSATTLANTAQVPTAPTSAIASAASSTQITVSWTDTSSNETGFKIERGNSTSGPWAQIGTTAGTSFSSTGLSASTSYSFRVRSYNAAGDSAFTNVATATTLAAPPAAPTSLSATAASTSQINLSWIDNSSNESSFKIERAASTSGPWTQIATTATGVTTFGNTGLTTGTSYSYRVRSSNAAGDSAYTNTASATTTSSTPIPTAPSGLSATAASSSQITVSWTDNATNETGYKVERGTSSGGPFTQIGVTGIDVKSYQDSSLTASTTYYYRARAYNTTGDSAYSNTGSATTQSTSSGTPGSQKWSKRFGDSSAVTEPSAAATDINGNAASIGTFFGTMDFGGGVSVTSGGGYDGFVAKYSAAGAPVWAKRLGGSLSDYAYGVTFDASGNVIVAGEFQGSADFGCGSLSNPTGNSFNMFIVKLSGSNGSCIWSKNFGGQYRDSANAVAVDASSNILVGGHFWGTVSFGGTSLTSHASLNYDPDIFILKLDSSGNTIWAKGGFGGSSYDTVRAIAVDSSANVYIGGDFDLGVDFGSPTSALTCVGFPDAYIAKFSSSGTPIWSKRFGDGYEQRVTSLVVDHANNIVVSGWFRGGITFSSLMTVPMGSSSTFLAKLDPQGGAIWQKSFQDSDELRWPDIAVDAADNVYMASQVKMNVDFGGGAVTTLNTNLRDWLVAKYRADGAYQWARRFSGTNESWGRGVATTSTSVVSTGYISGSVDFGGGTIVNGSAATHAGVMISLNP